MLIFALGTSYGVQTQIKIKNNSSQNIRIKITINYLIGLYNEDGNSLIEYDEETDSWIEYTEELILNRNQTEQLKMLISRNKWPEPHELICSFVIYNEKDEIIKEYNTVFFLNFKKSGSRNNRIYTLIITDELLK
jgi:hypothetical protein